MVFISSSLLLASWKRILQILSWLPFFPPPSCGENLLQIWEILSQTSWIPCLVSSFSIRSSPEVEQSGHLNEDLILLPLSEFQMSISLMVSYWCMARLLKTCMWKPTFPKWHFAGSVGVKGKTHPRGSSPRSSHQNLPIGSILIFLGTLLLCWVSLWCLYGETWHGSSSWAINLVLTFHHQHLHQVISPKLTSSASGLAPTNIMISASI